MRKIILQIIVPTYLPNEVDAFIIAFNDIPEKISKRFQASNLNSEVIRPVPASNPDLSKYLALGLGTINFGYALIDDPISRAVFWGEDIVLRYGRNVHKVPKQIFDNYQRYAYLHCEFANTATIGFINS